MFYIQFYSKSNNLHHCFIFILSSLFYRFVGRFIALALYHSRFIDNGFTLPFYKRMLNKNITLADIETVDVEYYNSLKFIQ